MIIMHILQYKRMETEMTKNVRIFLYSDFLLIFVGNVEGNGVLHKVLRHLLQKAKILFAGADMRVAGDNDAICRGKEVIMQFVTGLTTSRTAAARTAASALYNKVGAQNGKFNQ